MKNIIQPINMQTDEKESCSLDPARKLSSVQKQRMQCLCGEDSLLPAENAESTAPFSETSQSIRARNLSDKRIKSLIASGLVAGITPMSVRKQSNQQTLDFALSKQDGSDLNEKQEAD